MCLVSTQPSLIMECINEDSLNLFNSPSRIIVAGYSNSGKTRLVSKIVEKYYSLFKKIIICGVDSHPIQNNNKNIEVIISKDIIDASDEISEFEKGNILYILDDIFIEAVENKHVLNLFTKGRHSNISCILITQNLFFSGKYARSISLNASHYLLLKQRDLNQIECLGRQIYGKDKARDFLNIYKKAMQERQYSYLLVDLSSTSTENIQFRTNIVGEPPCEVVYRWS